ncbi:MAG: single-stranded-DNA-specific exonuclease RecJ [Desulfobulbaceae bacterium]|nr:single-stranded-DNA-specific exonuclease RecJ [Desulfobulbaceae bacterium]HIJ79108.1 single-stranded-DNA-specific exonuclease RecJ [Deltaproteobacteria bacterium]
MSGNPAVKWLLAEYDNNVAQALAEETGLSLPIAALLAQRGLLDREAVDRYFMPSLGGLPSPYGMKGVQEAAALVYLALQNQQPVIVYGDYDVDGTTGSGVLVDFFREIGLQDVYCAQPLRLSEGYGLHLATLNRCLPAGLLEKQCLLVTVDCGISDSACVQALKEMGLAVIITDHHQPPAELPAADVLINPLQPGCNFSEKNLAGVGVAFYLIMGIRKYLYEEGVYAAADAAPNLKRYLDLVAVGTVADMVPLIGVNRILVKAGLEQLRQTKRIGLKELLKVSGLEDKPVFSDDIGYRLGPRLNAAGRMADAALALELLLADDPERARQLAQEVNQHNEARKEVIEEVIGQARALAEQQLAIGRKIMVIQGEGWHPGVIGIAASRLVEEFHRPVLLFAVQDGVAKGSGRTITGLNLYGLLVGFKDLFEKFGGHQAAVGLTMPSAGLAELAELLEQAMAAAVSAEMLAPKLTVDWQFSDIKQGRLDQNFFAFYERMEPFGQGNPEPLFSVKGRLDYPREVGVNHLKFAMRINGASFSGIGFNLADKVNLSSGQEVELAFHLRRNSFRGQTSWQLNAENVRYPTI